MRDLTPSRPAKMPAPLPKGIAFDIADLAWAQAWARLHTRPLKIRLDHCADAEEYEEVLEFHTGYYRSTKTLVWRSSKAVFVQPLPGKRRRYNSIQDALASLLTASQVAVSDIVATSWPTD